MNQAWPKHEPSMDPSTYGSNPPVTESNTESNAVTKSKAREDHDDFSEGRIDTSQLREQLGMSLFVPPASQSKWAGISRQTAEDVAGLVTWAAGTERPGSSFLACFDAEGKITAKRRGGNTPEDRRAKKQEVYAEIAVRLEKEFAEKQEAACKR